MASNFSALRKNSQSELNKLTSAVSKLQGGEGQQRDNDGYWKPEVDKAGNGSAIIRFLPAPPGEDVPFVRIWDHGFQGPGGWFIEKSLTTLGQKCPVSEYNSMLWNQGTEQDKAFVRTKTKRRLSYISNIYVVKDPANPQNEGQVFLYKFGKKIFDKINDQMVPEFDDESPVNPFDLWEGADFRLKIRNVEGYRNYDKSEFDSPSVLGDLEDDALEDIWNKEKSLSALIDPSQFRSYDELKAKLYKALALDGGPTANTMTAEEVSEAAPPVQKERAAPVQQKASAPWQDDEEDDGLAFFQKLAEED